MPLVKKVANSDIVKTTGKKVVNSASDAVINVAADAISGKSARQSMKKNLDAARQDIANAIRTANKRNLPKENDIPTIASKKAKKSPKKQRKTVKFKVNTIKKHPRKSYSVFNDE